MLTSTRWASPTPDVFRSLSPGVVHVWRVRVDTTPSQVARLRLTCPKMSGPELNGTGFLIPNTNLLHPGVFFEGFSIAMRTLP